MKEAILIILIGVLFNMSGGIDNFWVSSLISIFAVFLFREFFELKK